MKIIRKIKKGSHKNIKPNIERKITSRTYNYKGADDLKKLPKLFPQEDKLNMKIVGIKQNRVRYKEFPNRLPTNNGEMPYPPDEHEMIGQYEFPHNTYLILAHAYNTSIARIEKLEKEIAILKQQIAKGRK